MRLEGSMLEGSRLESSRLKAQGSKDKKGIPKSVAREVEGKGFFFNFFQIQEI